MNITPKTINEESIPFFTKNSFIKNRIAPIANKIVDIILLLKVNITIPFPT